MYEQIGQRLKAIRERSGLTQEQVAKYLGVAREVISYYENGRRTIDLVSLKKLADLYGYSVEYFITDNTDATKETTVFAFRGADLGEQDLETLAWAQLMVRNLSELDSLLSKE